MGEGVINKHLEVAPSPQVDATNPELVTFGSFFAQISMY